MPAACHLENAFALTQRFPQPLFFFAVPFGAAGKNARDQINKIMQKQLDVAGISPTKLVQMRAQAKAQAASGKQLTEMSNAVGAYEKLAKFNGERILQLIDNLDDTGLPVLEGFKRRAQRGIGSDDSAELMSVLIPYQTDVARIINNPRLVGVLPVEALKEAQNMVPSSMTKSQAKRIIGRIAVEMDMRAGSIALGRQGAFEAMTAPLDNPGGGQNPPSAVPGQPNEDVIDFSKLPK